MIDFVILTIMISLTGGFAIYDFSKNELFKRTGLVVIILGITGLIFMFLSASGLSFVVNSPYEKVYSYSVNSIENNKYVYTDGEKYKYNVLNSDNTNEIKELEKSSIVKIKTVEVSDNFRIEKYRNIFLNEKYIIYIPKDGLQLKTVDTK